MKLRILLLATSTAIFSGSIGHADPFGTTADLYKMCRSSTLIENTSCTAYLLGFWEGIDNTWGAVKGHSIFCNRAPVSAGVLREVFMAWVDRHPQSYAKKGFLSAMEAFLDAYSCSRPKSEPLGNEGEKK